MLIQIWCHNSGIIPCDYHRVCIFYFILFYNCFYCITLELLSKIKIKKASTTSISYKVGQLHHSIHYYMANAKVTPTLMSITHFPRSLRYRFLAAPKIPPWRLPLSLKVSGPEISLSSCGCVLCVVQ